MASNSNDNSNNQTFGAPTNQHAPQHNSLGANGPAGLPNIEQTSAGGGLNFGFGASSTQGSYGAPIQNQVVPHTAQVDKYAQYTSNKPKHTEKPIETVVHECAKTLYPGADEEMLDQIKKDVGFAGILTKALIHPNIHKKYHEAIRKALNEVNTQQKQLTMVVAAPQTTTVSVIPPVMPQQPAPVAPPATVTPPATVAQPTTVTILQTTNGPVLNFLLTSDKSWTGLMIAIVLYAAVLFFAPGINVVVILGLLVLLFGNHSKTVKVLGGTEPMPSVTLPALPNVGSAIGGAYTGAKGVVTTMVNKVTKTTETDQVTVTPASSSAIVKADLKPVTILGSESDCVRRIMTLTKKSRDEVEEAYGEDSCQQLLVTCGFRYA